MIASNKSCPGVKEIHRQGFASRAGLAAGDKFITYATGNNIIIDSLSSSSQVHLKGHDNIVNCLCLSNNQMIASGQLAAPGSPNYDSPALLWKLNSLDPIGRLFGLKQGVKELIFSSDCRFLGGVSFKDQLIIWDLKSQNQIYNKNLENPISILSFSGESMVILNGKILQSIQLNPILSQNKPPIFANFTLPSTGLPRNYSCLVEAAPACNVIGTESGQLCIFSKGVFKSSLIVGKGKVLSICSPNNKDIYVVVGNEIAKYEFINQQLKQKSRITVERARTIKANKQGQLFIMSQDSIYRLSNDLKMERLMVSHNSRIHQVSHKNGIISSIDQQGCIISRSYKNGKVSLVNIWRSPKYTKGRCIQVAKDGNVIAGFADGNLVCLSPDCKNIVWEMGAHKGPVTSIFDGGSYLLTGGEDCVVRIWSSSRQLINQLSTHQKTVSKVLGDALSPNIIYSCSLDRSIQAYDLKNDKKLYFKQVNNGNITDMIQQPKSGDLITCGVGTTASFWKSSDYQPYRNTQPHSGSAIRLAINPNGTALCLGCDNGQISINSLKSSKQGANLDAHSRQVTGMQWINQNIFVSVSEDQSIAFWNYEQI